ncbi:MAG: hypothetical protein L0H41_09215 [Microlunatus sp.]|nr:hypothetical protein [Microlunatus sp.]MDN5804005.1 hypothetical protein [Microlunatus sp.]
MSTLTRTSSTRTGLGATSLVAGAVLFSDGDVLRRTVEPVDWPTLLLGRRRHPLRRGRRHPSTPAPGAEPA